MESLKTKDRREAEEAAHRRDFQVDQLFREAEARLAALRADPEARRRALAEAEAFDAQMQFEREEMRRAIEEDDALQAREPVRRGIVERLRKPASDMSAVELALRDMIPDEEFASDEEKARRTARIEADWREGAALAAEQFVGLLAPSPAAEVGDASSDDVSLDALVDRWAKERQPDAKSQDAHRAVARRFTALAGPIPVDKITKRDVLKFKDGLLEDGTTPANVNVKLTRLRTLLNFAFHNDLIATQPAKGVTVLDPDADRNKRRPFDRAALAAIFGSPVYAKGERPTQGRGEAAYWLPLLALYTGARMEELGQLRPGDVRQETYLDGEDVERMAWVIHVTEDADDGLKIKTAGSERLVPVHPELEALGFIRFVEAAQKAGQARIFPALKPNKYGRLTAKWGEWFSLYKRDVCGVTDGRMVFHSFRHTFKDNARNSGMIEGVQRQIMGHSGKDVADDYGSG